MSLSRKKKHDESHVITICLKKKTHIRRGSGKILAFLSFIFRQISSKLTFFRGKIQYFYFLQLKNFLKCHYHCSYYFFITISYILVFFVISRKIINLLQFPRYLSDWNGFSVCYLGPVWKFQHFSVTHILREINFLRSYKIQNAIFCNIAASEFWFLVNFTLHNVQKLIKIKFQRF